MRLSDIRYEVSGLTFGENIVTPNCIECFSEL